jgi:hypothetical protein
MKALCFSEIGWGGWTRTNTILINSEVSYQLDHAPTLQHITLPRKDLLDIAQSGLGLLDWACASFGASWTLCNGSRQALNGCEGVGRGEYRTVMAMLLCPRSSWTIRKLTPAITRRLAKVCRRQRQEKARILALPTADSNQ